MLRKIVVVATHCDRGIRSLVFHSLPFSPSLCFSLPVLSFFLFFKHILFHIYEVYTSLVFSLLPSPTHITGAFCSRMLDYVLTDLLKVEEAGDGVEALRRSLAPIRTLAKDAAIVARAADEGGASATLFKSAQTEVRT